eukprot:jgi/Undpi1/521/HiC_scaffold_10.g03985.m1
MVTGQSGRRTRASFVADDDRTAATGTDELVWDTHAVTTSSASELVWPKSDSPARSQEVLPAPVETQLVDADTTTITAATTAATVTAATVAAALAAVTVAIVLGQPLDAAAATTTTTNVELLAAQASASTDIGAILTKAGKASFGGGASGAAAAVVQVLSLMWLRTTMNFQYKNGGSTEDALRTLWEEGGVPRLYKGVSFALVQGPLSRFGDTAANVGVLALLEAFESTRSLPLPVKSAAGSVAAGLWRIGLTPIDAYKTTLQVSGAEGTKLLTEKVAANGPSVLFEGALATATATFVGHYPCPTVVPPLTGFVPVPRIGVGLCSSCVSDCCSNSIRVIKTTKQTAPLPISYPEAFKQVVDDDGVTGLFLRGLQTRILVNALQGALFAVAWKYFQEMFRTGGGF